MRYKAQPGDKPFMRELWVAAEYMHWLYARAVRARNVIRSALKVEVR